MSVFPGIGHLELGEKYRIYINMVLGCTNIPTFQNILSLEKLYLTIFSSSAPVLSSVSSFSSVFSSVMLLLPLSAASTPFCFSQNSDFKILDGCLKVLKYKSMKKCFIVCNTSSIVLLEGNLAETGLIAFMNRNFQLSTILRQIVENHTKFL